MLTKSATGVGSKELERCRVPSRSHDHHGVLHGAGRLEGGHGLCHRRVLLADCHIDALHSLTLLVQDCVDRNSGLSRLAVTNDQLTLATADRGHGVNRLDASLQRLPHGLTSNDSRSLDLHASGGGGVQRSFAVDGLAEGVNHSTQQRITTGNRENPSGGLDHLLLFEVVNRTEDDGTDGVLVQVHRQAQGPVLELEELVNGAAGKARDPGDTVGDLNDATDLLRTNLGGVVGNVALKRLGDLIGADCQLCHGGSFIP